MHIRQPEPDIRAFFTELEPAIQHVWRNYLSRPFQKEDIFWETADNFMLIRGQEIPRPNHGIVHTLRVAALIVPVVEFFKENINFGYQEIMDRYDTRRIKLLMLAALFSVVGRQDETGFRTKVTLSSGKELSGIGRYKGYRKLSAQAFKTYCMDNQNVLDLTSEEITYYTKVVREMGDPASIKIQNEGIEKYKASLGEKEVIADSSVDFSAMLDFSILRLAHCLDLFRCAEKEIIKEVLIDNHDLYDTFLLEDYKVDFENLMSLACRLIQKTGDRLMSKFTPQGGIEDCDIEYDREMYSLTALNPSEVLNILEVQLSVELHPVLKEEQLVEYYKRAIADLPHGPRQKTDATRDLESICKALLSSPEKVRYGVNYLDEIEVIIEGVGSYNLPLILKNEADFEQLELADEEVNAYVPYLKKAHCRPVLDEGGHFPTEEDYAKADPKNELAVLSYAEKLAITLYCGDKIYRYVNRFLRTDAKHSNTLTTKAIGEFLLLSAVATRGLMKLAAQVDLVDVNFSQSAVLAKLYRVEDLSGFNIKRQLDIKYGRVTPHKGFFSTSRHPEIASKLEMESVPLKIILLGQREVGNLSSVEKIVLHQGEEEQLYPPGGEVKYVLHLQDPESDQEIMYGVFVRTIDTEKRYRYGTPTMRQIRWETVDFVWANSEENVQAKSFLAYAASLVRYKKWLKAIAVTEAEFDFFNKDILLNYKRISNAEFKFSYNSLKHVSVMKNDIFYFMRVILKNGSVTALGRLLANYEGLIQDCINHEFVISRMIGIGDVCEMLVLPELFRLLRSENKLVVLSLYAQKKGLFNLAELYSQSLLDLEDLEKLITCIGNGSLSSSAMSILASEVYGLYSDGILTITDLEQLLKVKQLGFQIVIYQAMVNDNGFKLTDYLMSRLLGSDDGRVLIEAVVSVREMQRRYYADMNLFFLSSKQYQLSVSASELLNYFTKGYTRITEQQLALLKNDKSNADFFDNYGHLLSGIMGKSEPSLLSFSK